jgi:O-antigen/teichoic acid export membrane protein
MTARRATLSAGRWTVASAVTRTCLQMAQMAVIARVLDPADFGLMAITVALISVVSLLSDFGVSRAIIHYDEIDAETLSTLYWFNVGLSVVLTGFVAASASLIASLYALPALAPIVAFTAPAIALASLGQQFNVRSEKMLQFAVVSQNEIAAATIAAIVCIAAALAGAGVYALVAGTVTNAFCGSLLALARLAAFRIPTPRYHFDEARKYLRMGFYLVGENAAATVTRQSDIFVGGLFMTPVALGLYSLPRDLCLRVAMAINPIATRIGFPVMARVKHDAASLKSAYLQIVRMTASINFPLYIGIAFFAREIIVFFYGVQWASAAPLLRWLAVWGLLRSTANLVGSLLYAVGRARRTFWWNLAQTAVLPIVYWIAARERGSEGLAASLVLSQLALLVPTWVLLIRPACGASLREYLMEFAGPLVAAIGSGAVAWMTAHALEHGTIRLAVGGIVGATTYIALSAVLNRRWLWTMIDLLKMNRRKPA